MNDLAVVTVCSGHEAAINSIVFSDDGSRLLTASADGTVRIWNADSGPELTRLRGSDSEVWCALFSRDGEHVISGSRDGRIRIWHIADREVIAELTGHRDYVYSLALAPDGETIASGSGDGTVRLWGAEPPPALRRAARERREAVEELTPGVTRLFDEWTDPAAVVQRLRAKFAGRELELALQICLAESVRRRR